MPVIHRGLESERGIVASHLQPASTRLQKAEHASIKKAVLARFKEGEQVADPTTGAIAVVDKSAPLGLRPLWKASNAHNHLGTVRLGDKAGPITKGKPYRGAPYGKAGTDESMEKARKTMADFQKNSGSRI